MWPYLYAPPSLLLFYPLSLFSFEKAHVVFLFFSHLLLISLFWLVPRALCYPNKEKKLNQFAVFLTFSTLITFGPVAWTLQLGQVNILLLFLLVVYWFFAKQEKYLIASVALGLSIILKTYPIVLLAPLIIIRRYKEVFGSLLVVGFFSLLSLPLLPNNSWTDWLVNVVPGGKYLATPKGLFHPGAEWNQSFNGFFSKLSLQSINLGGLLNANENLKFLIYFLALIFIVCLALTSFRIQTFRCQKFDRIFLVSLPTIFLIAPFSWDHHMVYLIPSIFLLLTCSFEMKPLFQLAYWLVCVAFFLLLSLENIPQFKFYAVLGIWFLTLVTAGSKRANLISELSN